MNRAQLKDLLLQALEHERGGVEVYTAGLQCAVNDELRQEWRTDLEQTRQHVQIVERVCRKLQIDSEEMSPGRQMVHALGMSLVSTMEAAKAQGDPVDAQTVACECVTLAEAQDYATWDLIGRCATALDGLETSALLQAYDEVDEEEGRFRHPPNARDPKSRRGVERTRH